ncbi:3 beta-hydroxysteroid dehydrogenase/Delta 5--_4-isomerase [Aquisphaera giovannonii]|uniref:3 beta-hydroxysteroid dehydrogenase/Delta 5-->4-isomerase n=1 Tax=Aquisphaera giovannonii TaxID=406548 RepID=A0A5B9VVX4_9BACT|nr:NAD-dependent epimerase/dehydratase family protein [Aquisphaera giovannonii]QEH32606.1 3 beta-hydroxysteroid dehydrogenase/Delta 5-->4-isomerase [Aquisphaera giovannonii]
MSQAEHPSSFPDPAPGDWPVLVTGAGGFVGGHVARHLAAAGHSVRGLARTRPLEEPGDPPIEWILGDLRDERLRLRAVEGVRGVIHTAAWVSLGKDPKGLSRAINVEATRQFLDEARRAGVERFVLTSTLHTLASGTADAPADEDTPWNLECVDSPYCRTKREAEAIVRGASEGGFSTVTLCPAMVLGPRDPKPTSTRLLRVIASSPVSFLPRGGIPIVDSTVIATAHRRALIAGEPGARYAIAGPYLSYPELGRLVGRVAGWPRAVAVLPDFLQGPMMLSTGLLGRFGRHAELSATTVSGGFLRLHVSGRRADATFGLVHPPAIETIRAAMADTRDSSNDSRPVE